MTWPCFKPRARPLHSGHEERLTAGARFDLKHVGVEVHGGYVFDRFYFQGERYSERRENRFDVEAGPFVGIRIGVRWWPGGGL